MESEKRYIETGFPGLEEEYKISRLNESGILSPVENLPTYIRLSVGILTVIIFCVGTIGNTMVAMVIISSRDMRTSTNFFLVNLSVADMLILLMVTPTAFLEVVYHPEIWVLGRAMCSVVPMLELLVCHASVLTILAISFERYYAICSPLKVLYVCTRTRAVVICVIVWIAAFVISSPMLFMTVYIEFNQPRCIVVAGSLYPDLYTVSTIIIFFLLPLVILLVTFQKIAQKLTMDRSSLNAKNEHQRAQQARSQVVLMLGTVVFTFFLCLLPFRVLTLFVILVDVNPIVENHQDIYYSVLYFSRAMHYTNSAINPFFYNFFSTKFRNGFRALLCGGRRKGKAYIFHRNGTFMTIGGGSVHGTTTTNLTNSVTSPELKTRAKLEKAARVIRAQRHPNPIIQRVEDSKVRKSLLGIRRESNM